jgi:hypothetical protein
MNKVIHSAASIDSGHAQCGIYVRSGIILISVSYDEVTCARCRGCLNRPRGKRITKKDLNIKQYIRS